jgi:hypothetical protein
MTDLTEIIANWRKDGAPGPWATAGRYWIWVVAGKLHIATIARAGENPANAALIAAAPDMADRIEALEAENARLRNAVRALLNCPHISDRDPHPWSEPETEVAVSLALDALRNDT